jgi:hypothetical protein
MFAVSNFMDGDANSNGTIVYPPTQTGGPHMSPGTHWCVQVVVHNVLCCCCALLSWQEPEGGQLVVPGGVKPGKN